MDLSVGRPLRGHLNNLVMVFWSCELKVALGAYVSDICINMSLYITTYTTYIAFILMQCVLLA